VAIEGIAFALGGVHEMLGLLLKAPELAMEEIEKKMIAQAIVNVAPYYPIVSKLANNKSAAEMQLLGLYGMYMIGRIQQIRARMSADKAKNVTPAKQPPAPSPVVAAASTVAQASENPNPLDGEQPDFDFSQIQKHDA
jgi:hypothetical protein